MSEKQPARLEPVYNDRVVRLFALAAVLWGVVGMLVGVIIAAQLAWPEFLGGIPWLSYGRLRPLHTNAVIFAFGGCALFATSYHVVQRTCQTKLFASGLAEITFWGWQLVIVAAALSLPLGYTTGKEYAELEWPIDILITLVWVSYAVVFFGTIGIRPAPWPPRPAVRPRPGRSGPAAYGPVPPSGSWRRSGVRRTRCGCRAPA